MKRIFRLYVIETFSLYLVSRIAGGVVFASSYETLLITGAVLMGATLVAKPVINILLLPLNLVTFGFFKWISSTVALYLVTLVVDGFSIEGFYFEGFVSQWIDIPAISFGSPIIALIVFSFLLSLISSLIGWIVK